MLEHLDEDLTVEQLARRALMSTRTFARRLLQTTPTAYRRTFACRLDEMVAS